jgi:hypothetical protein
MGFLYFVWLIFAALFFYFAYFHWQVAKKPFRPFQIRQMPADPAAAQAIQENVRDFNNYLEGLNNQSKARNQSASMGFLIAGFTALISLVLTTLA